VGIPWVRDCKKIQKTQTHETCHRVILWVDFSVGRGSAVGCAHACALARLHRFVLLSAGTLCPTIRAMVSIRGHAYGRWVRLRRALAARLIVMQNMGYFRDELGVLLRAFRRAPKEVALLRDRSLQVTAASLNLKRSSLGVQRRRFFFCLLHGSQSPAPTSTSPHPSSTGPSGKQSSFRACPSHANPAPPSSTQSWAPDRVMASMWRKAGMRLQPRKDKKRRSTRCQKAKAFVPQSRCCTAAEAPGKSTGSPPPRCSTEVSSNASQPTEGLWV